jgi:hypothetical protein
MQPSMSDEIRAPGGRTVSGATSRPRRELSLFDRLVRIPLGFLWLIVIAIVAVPTILVMTLLYHLTDGFKRIKGAAGARGDSRAAGAGRPDT